MSRASHLPGVSGSTCLIISVVRGSPVYSTLLPQRRAIGGVHISPPMDDETRMLDLRDQILAAPKDIEDLVLTGQASETCPYFGTRRAIPQAQVRSSF